MSVCKNCRYFDDHTRSGYKGYCTEYREYVDPDSRPRDCRRYEEIAGSNGGCYLTTACVKSKGLPDDCFELTTLRNFRDTYMKNIPEGKQDISHYYRIAPRIVDKINASERADEKWEEIYNDMVLKSIDYIESCELDEAYKLYKEYSLKLEKEFM